MVITSEIATMPLIEGFGDEVTLLLFALLAGVVMVLAWMSTQVDSRFLVPIIILDRERFSALMHRLRGLAEQRFVAGEQVRDDSPRPEGSEGEQSLNSGDVTSMESTTSSEQEPSHQTPENCLEEQQEQTSPSDSSTDLMPAEAGCNTNDDDVETIDEPCIPVNQTPKLESLSSATQDVCNDSTGQESTLRMANPDETQSPLSNENAGPSRQTDNEEAEASTTPEGHIQIRLQYVDGRTRMVSANPDDTVRDFKRNHFSTELAGQSIVRFVMSGQELRNDDLTLRSYRVSDGSVIHCLITQARVEPVITSVDSNHFDIGFLMFPLFGFILTLLWYARIAYRNYFSGASTCSLVAISFLYLVALVGSFRSGRINHPHHD